MTDINVVETPHALPEAPADRTPWNVTTRVLFRFAFVYLTFYSLIPLAFVSPALLRDRSVFVNSQKVWTAVSVFATKNIFFNTTKFDPTFMGSDSVLGWSQAGLIVLTAFIAAAVWSVLDRKHREYETLYAWLRVVVRIALALTLVFYGAQKVWPDQMQLVRPHQLLSELGSFTPLQLLWVFVGASPGYERFSGLVEVAAGALLFVPSLTTLGSLLAVVALTHVFALNVFYDVNVKLFSFHLLMMALFLLVADVRRLTDVFLFNRSVAPAIEPPLFQSRTAARAALIVQVLFGIVAISGMLAFHHGLVPVLNVIEPSQVPYYGVWDVDDFSVDGTSHAALVTDEIRWHRIVFDDYNTASIQRMNGAVIVARLLKDVAHGTMTFNYAGDPRPELREFGGPKWRAVLRVNPLSPDSLMMQGQYEGYSLTVRLERSKVHTFLEPNEPHWILTERPRF